MVSPTLVAHLPQHDVSCHVPIIRREPVQAASRSRSSEASSSASDACGRGSRGSTSRWRVAFLVVLGVLLVPARGDIDLVAWLAAGAWAIAGAIAWVVGSWVEVDVRRRRLAHDQSGLRSIGGWRLAAGATPQDPNVLLAMDLLVYLVDHATLARVPIRGRRHRSRTTYAVPLRTLARAWGTETGVSGRRADRILSGDLCDRLHVVRRVPVGTASAFRLTDTTVSGAIAHLEQVTGTPLVRWELGRDPAWDVPTAA